MRNVSLKFLFKKGYEPCPLYCGRFTLLDSKVSLIADQNKSINLFPAVSYCKFIEYQLLS